MIKHREPLKSDKLLSQRNNARKSRKVAIRGGGGGEGGGKRLNCSLQMSQLLTKKSSNQKGNYVFPREVSKVTACKVNKIVAFPKHHQITI